MGIKDDKKMNKTQLKLLKLKELQEQREPSVLKEPIKEVIKEPIKEPITEEVKEVVKEVLPPKIYKYVRDENGFMFLM
jgi:Ni,Fe-hydrogenase maturation factor